MLVSGIYLVLGLLRLGFVTHFLSRPIISAFLTAGSIIISLSQVGKLADVSQYNPRVPLHIAADTVTPSAAPHQHAIGLAAAVYIMHPLLLLLSG